MMFSVGYWVLPLYAVNRRGSFGKSLRSFGRWRRTVDITLGVGCSSHFGWSPFGVNVCDVAVFPIDEVNT